jgi:hypothetical protein
MSGSRSRADTALLIAIAGYDPMQTAAIAGPEVWPALVGR